MPVVRYPLESGGTVLVHVEHEPTATPVTRGMSVQDTIQQADQTFEAALTTVRNVAQGVVTQLPSLAVRPDDVTVQFGVVSCPARPARSSSPRRRRRS